MKIDSNSALKSIFTQLFKRYPIRIETIPDEPTAIGIGVFDVEQSAVQGVIEMIMQKEEELYPNFERELLPLVRNRTVTAKHYADMTHWASSSFFSTARKQVCTFSLDALSSVSKKWTSGNTQGTSPTSYCDTELSLAA